MIYTSNEIYVARSRFNKPRDRYSMEIVHEKQRGIDLNNTMCDPLKKRFHFKALLF